MRAVVYRNESCVNGKTQGPNFTMHGIVGKGEMPGR